MLLSGRAQREAAPLLAHIPSPPPLQSDDSYCDSDDPDDHDYVDLERLRAMDDLRLFETLFAGPLSHEMQRKHNEMVLQEQQASILKVEEWRSHTVRFSLFSFFRRHNSADAEYQLPL